MTRGMTRGMQPGLIVAEDKVRLMPVAQAPMSASKPNGPAAGQTIPLLAELKEKIPILFEDIEPLAKQSESMKKMR